MSLFPNVVEWGALITGVQSTVNFVFLVIIFVLLLKLFRLSIRLSQVENKLQTFAQTYAIDKFNLQEKSFDDTLKSNVDFYGDEMIEHSKTKNFSYK